MELAAALGGVRGQYTWLLNLGGRARVGEGGAFIPDDQFFLLAGGTASVKPWLRFGAILDTHLVRLSSGDVDLRGGLSASVEAGTTVFGAFTLRLTPWEDDTTGFKDGIVSGQLAVGLRAQ